MTIFIIIWLIVGALSQLLAFAIDRELPDFTLINLLIFMSHTCGGVFTSLWVLHEFIIIRRQG